MAKKTSAGLLLYRRRARLEVLLVHPGGPFWVKKDRGAWSVPKGGLNDGEPPLEAAKREFFEETGAAIEGDFVALNPITQKGGKTVIAWAVEGDFDPSSLTSNTFSMEWPPGSGALQTFPEVDRAAWFDLLEARDRILASQIDLIAQLERLLNPQK